MLLIAVGLWALTRSGLGTALSAIRMDEDAVKSAGISTSKLKLFAFMISALVAGIGGALYTHYLGSISPRNMFDINFLFTILIAALIGGEQSILGPILGAYFLTFLLEYLRPYIPGAWRFLLYGAIALIVYYYAPKGLYSIFQAAVNRLGNKTGKNGQYGQAT
jgi:branched-chain amino acid transport system permease protein